MKSPQLDLFETASSPVNSEPPLVWPDPRRFPLNQSKSNVATTVLADLTNGDNPLIVTGYASLDQVIDFLSRYAQQRSGKVLRVVLGSEPFEARARHAGALGTQHSDEIRDYWLEKGISLLHSVDYRHRCRSAACYPAVTPVTSPTASNTAMATPEPADNGAENNDAHPASTLHSAVTAVDAVLAAQHRAVLAAATADNTRRAYRSAVNHYLAWGGVLPADEAAIIRYLLTYAPKVACFMKFSLVGSVGRKKPVLSR